MDSSILEEIQTDFIFCSGAVTEVLKVGSSVLQGEDVLFLIIPGESEASS